MKLNIFWLICRSFQSKFVYLHKIVIMESIELQNKAHQELKALRTRYIDVVDVKKPTSIDAAIELSKVVSKLSPLVGNMLEFHIVDVLNKIEWGCEGQWMRQDPDFPDAIFNSEEISPSVGFEVKAWYPFATEITGRFKTSTDILEQNLFDVALIAWLPEFVFWGKPQILEVGIFKGLSVAEARNNHYHQPPRYLVREPQDTSDRTENLKQRNTLGFRFQSNSSNSLNAAADYMKKIGMNSVYTTSAECQDRIRDLFTKFEYREDTNYAKIDRIEHNGIEQFKEHVLGLNYKGATINQWKRLMTEGNENRFRLKLESLLG